MAGHHSVHGLMLAVENLLKQSLPSSLSDAPTSGKVQLLSSTDLKTVKNFGSTLGLWLYRVIVDATGRNRYVNPPPGSGRRPQRELPVNLHFLLISWGTSPQAELDLHSWGMSMLAAYPELDLGSLAGVDADWDESERAHIVPEEIPNEDLFKIWDALPTKYSLSSAYILKTARITLPEPEQAGQPVRSRVFAMEREG